ncbi:hypothetical protein CNO08_22175 [Lysobacter capsici]|nr:hypothetical protein CNO08_22175 [Lysobacter capsici]
MSSAVVSESRSVNPGESLTFIFNGEIKSLGRVLEALLFRLHWPVQLFGAQVLVRPRLRCRAYS